MYMNERKSGTNHVTAALAAEANAAPMGRVSVVFEYKNMFKLNCTPTTGDIYVSSGAMIWNGRHCGVVNTENVKYTPPESDTLYKQIIVAAQYRKDASSGVETVSLVALESEIVESQSAAMNLTMNTGSAEIGEATTLANFPLWRFVVTATTHTEPVQLFDVQVNYQTLRKRIEDCRQDIATETTARKELAKEVADMYDGIVEIPASNVSGYFSSQEARMKFTIFVIVFENGETMTIPRTAGTYSRMFCKNEGDGSLVNPIKVIAREQTIYLSDITSISIHEARKNDDVCSPIKAVYGIKYR